VAQNGDIRLRFLSAGDLFILLPIKLYVLLVNLIVCGTSKDQLQTHRKENKRFQTWPPTASFFSRSKGGGCCRTKEAGPPCNSSTGCNIRSLYVSYEYVVQMTMAVLYLPKICALSQS